MKSVLRFTLEKLDKLGLKKNVPQFFEGTFRDFFPKSDDRITANDLFVIVINIICYI